MNPLNPLLDAGTPGKAATPPDQGPARAVSAPAYDLPEDALVIVPVRNMVMFPGMIVPISIGRESSIKAAQYVVKAARPVGILMQRNPEADAPSPDDLAAMGTVAVILRYVTSPDGSHHIICQGQQRFRVLGYLDGFDFTVARIQRIVEPGAGPSEDDKREIEARYLQLKARALEVLQLLPNVPQEMMQAVQDVESPGMLADLVAGYVDIKPAEKQELLEEVDLRRRLDRVIDMLVHRIEVLNLSRDIDQRTKASIGEREREFLLREQLKTIQKKLGEGEADNTAELAELHKLIDEAQMPDEVAKQANKELKRLERMSDSSAE